MRFLFALLLCSAYWEEKCRGQCVPAGEGQADDAAQKHRVPEESRTGGREETQSRERGFVHPRLPLIIFGSLFIVYLSYSSFSILATFISIFLVVLHSLPSTFTPLPPCSSSSSYFFHLSLFSSSLSYSTILEH